MSGWCWLLGRWLQWLRSRDAWWRCAKARPAQQQGQYPTDDRDDQRDHQRIYPVTLEPIHKRSLFESGEELLGGRAAFGRRSSQIGFALLQFALVDDG